MTTEQIHDSRLAFEKWHFERFEEDLLWNAERNLYEDFGHHQAWIGWQACEAQHQLKVRELVAYLGQCASWDSADLAQIINKHFGE